jgi:hypothetical protein
MDRTKQEPDLKDALMSFETSLSTPIVSGELAAWIGEVQKAWTAASASIHDNVARLHPAQYEEMAQADPELLPRIEVLKADDEAIDQQRERVSRLVERDAQAVPKFEPDEGKAQKHLQSLVDEGLSFVIRVRKQEVAVETWLMEAFNRDRGAVD